MADKPIIFSAPMVRALLAGRKTQTRRVLKPQPSFNGGNGDFTDPTAWGWFDEEGNHIDVLDIQPNGFVVGDRIWVRETWRETDSVPASIYYRADEDWHVGSGWRSPIHMPREYSRLTLTVTDLRVQRVQDISEEDAVAEGVVKRMVRCGPMAAPVSVYGDGGENDHAPSARSGFAHIWMRVHDLDAWDTNPWVVALTFDVIQANIDQVE